MRMLTLREIQLKELEILLRFDSFCREHKLYYSLCAGTLLGAIRHKGFIPWDDDVDVMMPRPDYEKLLRLWRDDEHYRLLSLRRNGALISITRLSDTRVHVVSNEWSDISCLFIDIFPVDGLPEKNEEIKRIYRKNIILALVDDLCMIKIGTGRTFLRKLVKAMLKPLARITVKLYGRRRLVQKREELAQRIPYEESDYVGIIAGGVGIKEKMQKKDFESSVLVTFEGHSFPAMSCWNIYLTQQYDDYMTLPPLNDRVTHGFIAKIE